MSGWLKSMRYWTRTMAWKPLRNKSALTTAAGKDENPSLQRPISTRKRVTAQHEPTEASTKATNGNERKDHHCHLPETETALLQDDPNSHAGQT